MPLWAKDSASNQSEERRREHEGRSRSHLSKYRSPTFTCFVTNHRKASLPIRHLGGLPGGVPFTQRPAGTRVRHLLSGGNNWYEIALWKGEGREQVTGLEWAERIPAFQTHSSLYFPPASVGLLNMLDDFTATSDRKCIHIYYCSNVWAH